MNQSAGVCPFDVVVGLLCMSEETCRLFQEIGVEHQRTLEILVQQTRRVLSGHNFDWCPKKEQRKAFVLIVTHSLA